MDTAESIVIIQRISTTWTKQSRGSPGAIKRNATPEALKLPLEELPREGCSFIEHGSSFHERSGFEDPRPSIVFENFSLERPMRLGGVLLQREAGRVRVSWDYDSADVGMPLRQQKKNDVFELALNQWGRVTYNGRFNGEGEIWWYRKTVLNVGLFEKATASVFVGSVPDVIVDKTASLY